MSGNPQVGNKATDFYQSFFRFDPLEIKTEPIRLLYDFIIRQACLGLNSDNHEDTKIKHFGLPAFCPDDC